MDIPKLTITIIEFESGNAGLVAKILSDAGHTISMVESRDLERIRDSLESDLIILSVRKGFLEKDKFWQDIKAFSPGQKARSLIFGSLSDPEHYLKGLEAGIIYYIHTPCGKNFLLNRITELGTSDRGTSLQEKFTVSFAYRGNNYEISLPGNHVLASLISTMENSLDQNRMLINILKNKSIAVQNICEEPIMEDQEIANQEELSLEKEMYRALEQNEFRLYYQPVISLESDCLAGFESLIRWAHPERGTIPPDSFIPIAEKSEIIIPLGSWIIEEAMKQLHQWHEGFSIDQQLRVNINLSARQFLHAGLSDNILDTALKYKVQTPNIGLEITESAFMENMKMANLTLLTLKSLNFPLYLDDFGTGYSSLTYLLHFPVDILKIDKSFVEWMHIDEQSFQLVKSVIDLAKNMNKQVVAEGIESDDHYRLIKEFGCDYGQGYYFGKPLKADDAGLFIKQYCK
ncbi:MAG: hypothetical protein CVV44_00640 [Spirochaetae bacterium HGW-Spirochaetae-1]|jgi:EAL domain-containing protein (putative c-di-GMP-specific phosphodiesterase class I)/DNA-binding response OmpR family regulator|nr:MAG: hypothetical protein CVV44_00640 [Spirochaetae bacterium HGW-Spirochaetae-1]